MRKLLTRTLTICTIALLVYFARISGETGKLPTERANTPEVSSDLESFGEDVRVQVFNYQGAKVSEGTFASVRKSESRLAVEAPDVVYTTATGRVIRVRADFLDNQTGREQILSSKPGNRILVAEDNGITIESVGPLVYDPATGILETKAQADFRLGNDRGTCVGLAYRSQEFLRLTSQVVFRGAESRDGQVLMEGSFLELDLKNNKGLLRDGTVTTQRGADKNQFSATESQFDFQPNKTRLIPTNAVFNGSPSRFLWLGGKLEANRFEGRFDPSGRWIERFTTSADAVFTATSEDAYAFTGRGGRMEVSANQWVPQRLFSRDAVDLRGRRTNGEELHLQSEGGLETQFVDGKARSTRLFGAPVFTYGRQSGRAGNLRVLHNEHKILFTQGAELNDPLEQVHIEGDELLLADWDQPEREIFAFKFVTIKRFSGTPEAIDAFGDQVELHLPSGYLKLIGTPAKVVRVAETIEGNTIEITQGRAKQFDIQASGDVTLNLIGDKGTVWATADTLKFSNSKRLAVLENVSRLVMPERGELSCGHLEALLAQSGDRLVLERLQAERDIVFQGSRMVDGVRRPVSCQADKMDYTTADGILHFQGVNRDVVFSDAKVETRNRDLKYNLKDGSLRGDSAPNRNSTTLVPIRRNPPKTN